MNWFIYIGGWFLGWAFFNRGIDGNLWFKVATWSCIWVWICLKFIQ